ncbi:MAG: hypothetical protein CMP51_04110 [Flavobacteriales bacterium]|nr:hypothetical protein [Flavobacteriales bacterium]
MKKNYIFFLSLFICISFSYSQVNFPSPSETSSRIHKSPDFINYEIGKATPFWSEDFSGGIPSTWTNGSNPTPPVISAPWVYRGPGTNPGVNTGSQGAYAGTNGAIASNTASNGFVIFDSDYYDNGGTAGNFGAGPYPCNDILGGNPTGHVGTLTTDVIDCSMYPDVSIVFNSFYREYTGIAKVAFSLDGGITFTDTIEVHPDIEVNEVTTNDFEVMLRMPSNIAGNSNVQIQFIYDGTVLYSTYNGYYFWQIDDIRLIETPAHFLTIGDETYGGWWIGYQATGDVGIDYTFNPKNQANANPYRFEAVVRNDGAADQPNSTMNVNIENAGSSIWSGNSNPMTLYTNTNDTFVVSSTFSPTTMGYHQISYWASSDSFPTTDTIGRGAVVTDTVYGVDFDWNSDGENAGNGYFLGRSCGGQVLGNAFDVYVDDTATSISFHVNDQSVPGAQLLVELYEIDPMVTPYSPVYLETSDDYTITVNDIDSWVTVKLDEPVNLYAGTTYIAAVKGYANPIDTSLISSSNNDNTLSFIQDNGCDIGSGGFGYWYSASKPLMIRLNLGYEIVSSVNDTYAKQQINIIPNPNNGIFNIEFNSPLFSGFEISVLNILGQKVFSGYTESFSERIDLSNLDKGVYTLKLMSDLEAIERKFVIE